MSPETTLKISSTSSNNPLGGVAGGARTESGSSTHSANQTSSAGKSSVDLSAAARHLAALQDGSSDVQTQKIQQIRDAIASGQLQIDPDRIADGLLASVRDLLK